MKRVVFDECLDVKARHQFPEYDCVTVEYLQAKGLRNGLLLERIGNDFDVLITIDRTMQFQQNFNKHPRLAFIFITEGDGSVKELLPFVPAIREALTKIEPGQRISIP